jgi:hypothetical protein
MRHAVQMATTPTTGSDVNDFGIAQYAAVVPIELVSFGVE